MENIRTKTTTTKSTAGEGMGGMWCANNAEVHDFGKRKVVITKKTMKRTVAMTAPITISNIQIAQMVKQTSRIIAI